MPDILLIALCDPLLRCSIIIDDDDDDEVCERQRVIIKI